MYPLGGPSPPKKFGGGANFFPNPLGLGGVVQNFYGNSPWKGVPKTGFKILGLPQKIAGGGGALPTWKMKSLPEMLSVWQAEKNNDFAHYTVTMTTWRYVDSF